MDTEAKTTLQKIAFWGTALSAAGKVLQPATRLIGQHAVMSAIPSAMNVASSNDPWQSRLASGAKDFTSNFLNPKKMVGNIVGFNIAPALGAKAMGSIGKVMTRNNTASRFGKYLKGMEKTPNAGIFNKYIVGTGAGFVPSTVVGMSIGDKLGNAVTSDLRDANIGDLIRSQGRQINGR